MAATPSTDALFSPKHGRLLLIIEEYKSLRDEIARFQNQQKQIITGGVAAIAGALLTGLFNGAASKFDTNPLLILFLPLVFAPLSLLFFEVDLNVYIAAQYLATNLKTSAKKSGVNMTGVLGWEDFRACDKYATSYPASKWALFLLPSVVCLIACLWRVVSCSQPLWSIPFPYYILLTTDLVLIYCYCVLFVRTERAAKRLKQALPHC